MKISPEQLAILELVRIGIGISSAKTYRLPQGLEWEKLIASAKRQGVIGVMADGMSAIPVVNMPDRITIMKIMGASGRYEKKYNEKLYAIEPLIKAWHDAGIRVITLKGMAFARYYPCQKHRYSSDVDVTLIGDSRGDEIARWLGAGVDDTQQVHSKIYINDATVENHHCCCGLFGDKTVVALDNYLQNLLNGEAEGSIGDTYLECPNLMFDALFCIFHAKKHFLLSEGLHLSHIVDWILIRNQVRKKDKEKEVKSLCEKYGLTKFYKAFDGVADYVSGIKAIEEMSLSESSLLQDILYPQIKAQSRVMPHSLTAERILDVRNMWHNRWKFPLYSNTSIYGMYWIYVKGYMRRFLQY